MSLSCLWIENKNKKEGGLFKSFRWIAPAFIIEFLGVSLQGNVEYSVHFYNNRPSMILIVESPSLAEISQSSTDGRNIEDEHYIKAPSSGMKTRGKKLR